MTRIKDPERTACPALATLDPVLAYWNGLRRGRAVPARADLDPDAMQAWLRSIGLVERTVHGHLRLRVGGRIFHQLMGVEARGMPFRAMFAPDARRRLQSLTDAVFDGPNLLILHLELPAGGGAGAAGAMALLPLTDNTGGVTRALVHVATDPAIVVRHPCRFRISLANLTRPLQADERPRAPNAPALPILRVIRGGRV
jgi:hypothetical protein